MPCEGARIYCVTIHDTVNANVGGSLKTNALVDNQQLSTLLIGIRR